MTTDASTWPEIAELRARALAYPAVARLAPGADGAARARLEALATSVGGEAPADLLALYAAHDGLTLGAVDAPETLVLDLVAVDAMDVVRGDDGEPRLLLATLGDDDGALAFGFDASGRARLVHLWEGDVLADGPLDLRALLRVALARSAGRSTAWSALFP